MSANTSVGGIIAQGSKVEKLQEVQHQGPEWRRQKALTAAEEEKLRQQKQVRKTPESEKDLSVTERQPQHHEPDPEDPEKEEKESEHQQGDRPRKSGGSHIIDIVV
jgi:alkylated DNA repair dioxygenase AlkB